MAIDNPLLDSSGFPRFEEIRPEHIVPALDHVLGQNRAAIDALVSHCPDPGWDNVMAPLEKLDNDLERTWSPISHLSGVCDTGALRQAYEACLPKLSDYASQVGQNRALYRLIHAIRERENFVDLDAPRRKVVDNSLRDFHLSGIDLEADDREIYRSVTAELSTLSNEFSKNLLDATDAWTLHLTDDRELAGLPDTAVSGATEAARQRDLEGWVFTLHGPSYIPFMTYADNRALREKMYRAYATRASDIGPDADSWDNGPLMARILELRHSVASLLGFDNYTAYALESRMAGSAEEVEKFLLDLAEKSRPFAERELEELGAFALAFDGTKSLEAWDLPWYSEKLRQQQHDFSQEDLRPYFPLPRVLQGLFNIVERLFGVKVCAAKPPQKWHTDVGFYRVSQADDTLVGHFYVDLYAREKKRSGAWMADCSGRFRSDGVLQLPVALLTCNFSPPVDGRPSLLTHEEVMTLFHEFGHGLHHMLTKVDVLGVSGINGVPWDAVELPSQFLENWGWETTALELFSGHVDSGEVLPVEMLEKMRAARNFQSAMQMLRQVEYSLFDLRLHTVYRADSGQTVQSVLDQVRDEVAVVVPPAFNRFANSFGHIFAGGYAAGYYSYKWAEVLSADAFGLFEKNGIFDAETGKSFLNHILERGGSEDPEDLFRRFRGREPRIDALLRHSGLSLTEKAA